MSDSPSKVATSSVGPADNSAEMAPSAPRPASTQPSRATTSTGLVEDPVHVSFVQGHYPWIPDHAESNVFCAISARRTMLEANPSTLERSPAAAPPT